MFGGGSKNKNNKKNNSDSPAGEALNELREKGLDFFEKLMTRLQKKENNREALIVGIGFAFFGLIMVFAGASFISAIFSILCGIAIGAAITFFLCLVLDVKWDSDEGVGITSISMLLSAPFVQYGLKFADLYAVPTLAGLSMAVVAEILCNTFGVSDDPYLLRSIIEVLCFVAAFHMGQKYQDILRITVTSFVGAYLTVVGGCLMFGKFPNTKTATAGRYLGHIVMIVILAIGGIYYQSQQVQAQNSLLQ